MEKTILKVLIPQDEYYLREEKGGVVIVKTGKLAMQTVSDSRIKKEMMEEKGFSYNKIKKAWERPKVGGVVEDNLMEVLGYVWDENKYNNDGKRKKEHYVPYNWQE